MEGGKSGLKSEETKAKMSASKKGVKKSNETKAKMSEAKKLYWQNKKQNGSI